MSSKQCLHCGASNITIRKSPYGGYYCANNHAQCVDCNEALKNHCSVCNEVTHFQKVNIDTLELDVELGVGNEPLVELFKKKSLSNLSTEMNSVLSQTQQKQQQTQTSLVGSSDSYEVRREMMDKRARAYGGPRGGAEVPTLYQSTPPIDKMVNWNLNEVENNELDDKREPGGTGQTRSRAVTREERPQNKHKRQQESTGMTGMKYVTLPNPSIVPTVAASPSVRVRSSSYTDFKNMQRNEKDFCSAATAIIEAVNDAVTVGALVNDDVKRISSSDLGFESTKSLEQFRKLRRESSLVRTKSDNSARQRATSQPPGNTPKEKKNKIELSPSEYEIYSQFTANKGRMLLEQMQKHHNERLQALSKVSTAAENFLEQENKAHELIATNTNKLRNVFKKIECTAAQRARTVILGLQYEDEELASGSKMKSALPEHVVLEPSETETNKMQRMPAGSQVCSQCQYTTETQKEINMPQNKTKVVELNLDLVQKAKRIEELQRMRMLIETQEQHEKLEFMKMQFNNSNDPKETGTYDGAFDTQMKNVLKTIKEEHPNLIDLHRSSTMASEAPVLRSRRDTANQTRIDEEARKRTHSVPARSNELQFKGIQELLSPHCRHSTAIRVATVVRRARCVPYNVNFSTTRKVGRQHYGHGDETPSMEVPQQQSVCISVTQAEWTALCKEKRPEIRNRDPMHISRNPVHCPDWDCKRILFISDLNRHLIHDHSTLTMERMKRNEVKSFFLDPQAIRLNEPKCHMLYLVRHKVRDLGSDEYNNLLPIMVMSAKVSILNSIGFGYSHQPDVCKEVRPYESNEMYIMWLTGIVPDNTPIIANISLWPLNASFADMHTSRTSTVYSIRKSTDLRAIFTSSSAFHLTGNMIKRLSNRHRDMIGVQIVVH